MTVAKIRSHAPLALLAAIAVGEDVARLDWSTGFLSGVLAAWIGFVVIDRFAGSTPIYRRWYLLCRNELERLDPGNETLAKIGPRTSPREPWEDG